jgi:hypothetical protein
MAPLLSMSFNLIYAAKAAVQNDACGTSWANDMDGICLLFGLATDSLSKPSVMSKAIKPPIFQLLFAAIYPNKCATR